MWCYKYRTSHYSTLHPGIIKDGGVPINRKEYKQAFDKERYDSSGCLVWALSHSFVSYQSVTDILLLIPMLSFDLFI